MTSSKSPRRVASHVSEDMWPWVGVCVWEGWRAFSWELCRCVRGILSLRQQVTLCMACHHLLASAALPLMAKNACAVNNCSEEGDWMCMNQDQVCRVLTCCNLSSSTHAACCRWTTR